VNQPSQIQLPATVRLSLPAQHVAVIMQSLSEYGPHKVVHPVISGLEQQVLAQQVRPAPVIPPTTKSAPADESPVNGQEAVVKSAAEKATDDVIIGPTQLEVAARLSPF